MNTTQCHVGLFSCLCQNTEALFTLAHCPSMTSNAKNMPCRHVAEVSPNPSKQEQPRRVMEAVQALPQELEATLYLWPDDCLFLSQHKAL